MNPEQGIYVLWKRLGETPLQALERLRRSDQALLGASMTYVGRLDPAAEGTLIVLSGEAVHRRNEFLALDKDYEFDVLWGIETDTYDLLGLPVAFRLVPEDWRTRVELAASSLIGKFHQSYPPYSSKPVSGKPLFAWAREGRLDEIEIPAKSVTIHSLEALEHCEIAGSRVLAYVLGQTNSVAGDFRQTEISNAWESLLRGCENAVFRLSSFRATVSSGVYVRSLAKQMGEILGSGAVALRITRIRVGKYEARP